MDSRESPDALVASMTLVQMIIAFHHLEAQIQPLPHVQRVHRVTNRFKLSGMVSLKIDATIMMQPESSFL